MAQDISMEDVLSSGDELSQPQPSSPPTSALPTAGLPSSEAPLPDTKKKGVEDMFDDDEEDDAFLSSVGQIEHTLPTEMLPSNYTDIDIMRTFYSRLFPYRPVFQWLNHSPVPTADFAHREFAFTLSQPKDIYLRYQSFPSADLFRKQCVQMVPSRFEIGPVYSTNPRERKTLRQASMFRPISKELVFDIDMDSYDPIRTCCTGANICHKCWSFITMAIKVVDVALRDDFGFKHILWVYSGRRGAHAWVCDKRARELDDAKRKAIAGYMELVKGGDKGGKKVNVKRPLHPHIDRSISLLQHHFPNLLSTQDPWSSDPTPLLNLLPDPKLTTALSSKWDSSPGRSSLSKWSDIDTVASSGVSSTLDGKALRDAKQDILLEYTYPRLDAEVSKKLNHLLKSPFCVHPKTGRVCVPIDTRRVEEFDPFAVPTVVELLGDLDRSKVEHDQQSQEGGDSSMNGTGEEGEPKRKEKIQDWEKTKLKPYIDYFRGFVAGLLKDEERAAMKRKSEETAGSADAMEF